MSKQIEYNKNKLLFEPNDKFSSTKINPLIGKIFGLISVSFVVIILYLLFFNKTHDNKEISNKQSIEITSNVLILLIFIGIIFSIIYILVPDIKKVNDLFPTMNKVLFVVGYVIFLILFFRLLPNDSLNKYAYIITPLTILFGIYLFANALKLNKNIDFNVAYERIKMVILFLCMITLSIIYYSIDPGGFITKYFGYYSILTILLSVFAFLYLIILLTLPDEKVSKSGSLNVAGSFLKNFSKFSVYGSISLILFIILLIIGITRYPGGFLNNVSVSTVVIILSLLTLIFWIGGLISNAFSGSGGINKDISFYKKGLLTVFGLTISGLLITWLTLNLQNLSGQTNTISFILNLLLVLVVSTLIYKTINVETPVGNKNKNALFTLLLNLILYIPCLFSDLIDFFINTSFSYIILLIVAFILVILIYKIPSIMDVITLQGGKLLIDNPLSISTLNSISSYQELNGTDDFDYQYGLSFWVFIDAMPPSTNSSYNTYTSLLNFGNKPNIMYNASNNTLMITMETKKDSIDKDKDDNGNIILYKKSNIMLQKWLNIIINYNGGTLDIFLNNELVKSIIEVVPYMTLDDLTTGSDNGIKGGICNLVYFKKPLTSTNMYYLYNMVKDKTPPIINKSNKVIIKK